MEYLKGTQQECEMYNAWVSFHEKYKDTTQQWAQPFEREGNWYIPKNPKYESDLETVTELPPEPEPMEL